MTDGQKWFGCDNMYVLYVNSTMGQNLQCRSCHTASSATGPLAETSERPPRDKKDSYISDRYYVGNLPEKQSLF